MQLLYSLTVAMLITVVIMPMVIRFAPVFGLIDRPDSNRKVHGIDIPRCGGLAMAFGITIPLLWYLPALSQLLHLLLAASIILFFGVLDDRNNLDYRWKFFGQILAVIVVMHGEILIRRIPFSDFAYVPQWFSYTLTFFFILGVTNAVNLTDGLDGLAAGTTLLSLAFLFVLTQIGNDSNAAFITLSVIGGILGFLRYNTFPARAFMGDAGSQFLGFMTGCLALLITQADSCAASPVVALIILGLPVFDTLMVMTIRIAKQRSPFSPDRNHLHHQIMALGFRHNEAVAIIYSVQLLLLALAFVFRFSDDGLLLAIYLGFSLILACTLAAAQRFGWLFRAEKRHSHFVERRSFLLRKMNWLYQNSTKVIQGFLAVLLLLPPIVLQAREIDSVRLITILISVLLVVSVPFARFPSWATRSTIYAASVLSVYLLTASSYLRQWDFATNAAFITLALVLIVAIRLTRREQFRLDNQDMLILAMILIAPLLPAASFNRYAVGEFTLRLAVLMYSCEFILGKSSAGKFLPVTGVAVLSTLLALILQTAPLFS